MTELYLIVMRLLWIGGTTGLVFTVYLIWRRLRGCRSQRLSRAIWLVILLLPVLALPWPGLISIPAAAPDWVYHLRLPDPRLPLPELSWPVAVESRRLGDDQVIVIESWQEWGDDPSVRAESAQILQQLGSLIPAYWLLSRLQPILLLYGVGLLLRLAWQLYRRARRRKRQPEQPQQPQQITDPAWLRDLAVMRDRIGWYRRGILACLPAADLTAAGIVQQLRRRTLVLLSADDAALIDPAARQQALLMALDQQRRPDILLSLTINIYPILFWFTPQAWLMKQFKRDQTLWRQDRIDRRLRRYGQNRLFTQAPAVRSSHSSARLAVCRLLLGSIGALLIGCVATALWLNPARLEPDLPAARLSQEQNLRPHGITVVLPGSSDNKYRWASYHGWLSHAGQIVVYDDEQTSGVRCLGDAGETAWQLRLDDLIAAAAWPDATGAVPATRFILLDYNRLDDGRYVLYGSVYHNQEDRSADALIQISSAGAVESLVILESMLWQEFSPANRCVLSNGDLLRLRIHEELRLLENESGSVSVPIIETTFSLEKLNASGDLIWQFGPQDPPLRQLELSQTTWGSSSRSRQVSQIIAGESGGFILVISDSAQMYNQGLTHPLVSYIRSTNSTYRTGDELACISADGTLLWRRKIGGQAKLLEINDGVVAPDGRLYLAGTLRYQPMQLLAQADFMRQIRTGQAAVAKPETYQAAAVLALDGANGHIVWQQIWYGSYDTHTVQVLFQEDCLTALIQHNPYLNETGSKIQTGLSCESIIQFDRDGQIAGYAALPKAVPDRPSSGLIEVRPGWIRLPDVPSSPIS
jgi:hypothetical protein